MSAVGFIVVLTDTAEADLESLYDYICETRSVAAADLILAKMHTIVGSLQLFPERGCCPLELDNTGEGNVRQLVNWPYRVIYEIHSQRVEIIAVVDGRRDLRSLLRHRLMIS